METLLSLQTKSKNKIALVECIKVFDLKSLKAKAEYSLTLEDMLF